MAARGGGPQRAAARGGGWRARSPAAQPRRRQLRSEGCMARAAGRGAGGRARGGESGPAPDERQGSRGIHHRRGSIAPIGCRGREPRSGGGRPAPGKPPQWRAGPRGRRLRNGGLSAAPARAARAGSARPRATPPPQPLLPARRSSSLRPLPREQRYPGFGKKVVVYPALL